MKLNRTVPKLGLAAAGLVAGVVLGSTLGANAASPSPTASTSTSAAATDAHPGDNRADGVPESQEHHGRGHGLDMSGTVTAVGSSSVTIKTSTGTTECAVPSSSDIDKNGEAQLSSLAIGDAVTFSVEESNAKAIDTLHAGDEAQNSPGGQGDSTTAPSASSPAAS